MMSTTKTLALRLPAAMLAVLGAALLLAVPAAFASAYTYEVSAEQTWSDTISTETTMQYVQTRAYVPGDKSLNYTSVPIYTRTTTSGANSLGDVVGYKTNIYGTSPAWVNPFDGPFTYLNYDTPQYMNTKLFQVNDQRLAIGTYYTTGAVSHPFIYDLIHKKYTLLHSLGLGWTNATDINNQGQIVGITRGADWQTQAGSVYDCENGEVAIEVPTAVSTSPQRIDDEGNIYGSFTSPDMTETYFIARPDTPTDTIACSLVGRDDVFEELVFTHGASFEMSGDSARGVSIADFNGGGVTDILVDHGEGKVILYIGEDNFDAKTKYRGESFSTIFDTVFAGVVIPEQGSDVNGDGIEDSVTYRYPSTVDINLGKGDGTFYYLPQTVGATKLADMNGDGLLDLVSVSGSFISVRHQQAVVIAAPTPVEPVVTEPAPVDPVVVEEPAAADPVVTEPVVEEPAPVEPVAEEPVVVDPVVAPEPTPELVTDPAPASHEQPYLDALEAEFSGATLLKIEVDEEKGGAEFKIEHNGEKVEGMMDAGYTIVEIYS